MTNGMKHFSGAVKGLIPTLAGVTLVAVMGKSLPAEAAQEVSLDLGHGTEVGQIVPVNTMAKLTGVTKATPGGGLAPKGDEDVQYQYNAETMFGIEEDTAAPAAKKKTLP